ncbi:hypothetical protein QCA50_010175 [Cerrena zonata]|uniref:DRBM domain-containing protein n=1 Tax=Cerrena zonata TaxID=2478898 RepID=A0AAW0GBY1_9APHY
MQQGEWDSPCNNNNNMSNVNDTVALNNYLQAKGQLQFLVSREVSSGQTHAPQWKVTYSLHDKVIGEGIGNTKAAAKDAAAKVALEQFRAEEQT